MKEFAVIGLGRFGISLSQTLAGLGYSVLAIDRSEELVQQISDTVSHAVVADATEEEALKALGIRNFDVVIVAIGQDMQASILTTIILKDIGIKMVVAKALNELHGKVLEKIGADKVVYPERDMAIRLAHGLTASNVLDYMELNSEYSVEEVVVPEKMIGKTLGHLNLRAKCGITIIAVKKQSGLLVPGPGADTVFESGDIAIVIGNRRGLKHLEEQ